MTPAGGAFGRFGKPGVDGSVLPIADTVVALTVGTKIDASERIIRIAIVVANILFLDFDIFSFLSLSFDLSKPKMTSCRICNKLVYKRL